MDDTLKAFVIGACIIVSIAVTYTAYRQMPHAQTAQEAQKAYIEQIRAEHSGPFVVSLY